MNRNMLNQPILLLKKGTENMQGKETIISNIEACCAVVDVIRTTLGPRGMDKMIIGDGGTTISNDGATIIKLLNIEHPAAKSLADVAKSQDNEVGDGTTSVMIFAGELLKEENFKIKTFIIVAPSFDIVVPPSPIIILSIPLGPNVVRITSTTAQHASILLIIVSFPCIFSVPFFNSNIG